MGKFQQGEGGRPKGSSNKLTADLRRWITNFLESNIEQLEKDWTQIRPKDRILIYEKFLKYVLPTLQSTQQESEFDRLPDDQLDDIIDALKSNK